MPRPKGSTNKNKSDINNQSKQEETRQFNTYEEAVSQYVEGYVGRLFSDGILKTVSAEDLQKWLANPDTYYQEINNLMTYYYISDGSIYQLYDLVNTLPDLKYKINLLEQNKSYEKHLTTCVKALSKVKHKQLTRSLLSQEISSGTVVCVWLGDKKNPYLFIFDNLKYVFPKQRLNGEWVAQIDMEWFKTMKEEERTNYFENLKPHITESMYKAYINNTSDLKKKYITLPSDITTVLQTHTLYRNQRLGIPWGTSSLFDQLHKQKMKDLEKAIANKIINAIAVLKIGSKDKDEYANLRLKPNIKKKIYSGVKSALEKNINNGVTCIAIPEFADLSFPELKSDGLNPDKYESINNDITSSIGVSQAVLNGGGSNYASSKINLDILYKRIGVLLEGIEEVYNKLFHIILPSSVADDFVMEYNKELPLTIQEKLKALQTLQSQGYAMKPIVDLLGLDYQEFINQSIYEIETLKLRDRIIPPLTSYTITDSGDDGGRPIDETGDNDNTVKSKTTGANNTPRARV